MPPKIVLPRPNLKSNWIEPVAGDGKDRSHVPAQPFWTNILRVAQILLALLLLILTSFSANKLGSDAAGFGLTWFTFILTLFYFAWLGTSLHQYPLVYHPIAHLAVEVLVNVFWLSSWAVLAREATSIRDSERIIGLSLLPSKYRDALNCFKASAALGALEWVLFDVTLVNLVLALFPQFAPKKSPDPEEGPAEIKGTELHERAAASSPPAPEVDSSAARAPPAAQSAATQAPYPEQPPLPELPREQ